MWCVLKTEHTDQLLALVFCTVHIDSDIYPGGYCVLHKCVYQGIIMANIEAFDEWAKTSELSQPTVDLLRENGFTTIKACKLLTPAIIQKNFAKSVPLTHTLLLQNAVEDLASDPSRATGPDIQTGLHIPGDSPSRPTRPQLGATDPERKHPGQAG